MKPTDLITGTGVRKYYSDNFRDGLALLTRELKDMHDLFGKGGEDRVPRTPQAALNFIKHLYDVKSIPDRLVVKTNSHRDINTAFTAVGMPNMTWGPCTSTCAIFFPTGNIAGFQFDRPKSRDTATFFYQLREAKDHGSIVSSEGVLH